MVSCCTLNSCCCCQRMSVLEERLEKSMSFEAGNGKSLQERFKDAELNVASKLNQVPEDMQLMLYGFYMQAKEGDVKGPRPSFFNRKERAKHDFWSRHKGMPRAFAK